MQALIDAPDRVELEARPRAIVSYAIKLTVEPSTMKREDIEVLRQSGLDDRDILHVNMICGYFAFVNRLADGLGVPLEPYWSNEPDP